MEENSIFLKYLIDEEIYIIEQGSEISEAAGPSSHEASRPEPTDKPAPRWHYRGNNTSGVAIIVENPVAPDITEQEEGLLTKILASVKLNLEEVVLLNLHQNQELKTSSLTELGVRHCLIFVPDNALIKAKLYTAQQVSDITYLVCNTLDIISSQVSEKKLLWSALQKLFLSNEF